MAITSDKLLNRSTKNNEKKIISSGGPSNVVLTKRSVKDIASIKVNVIKIEGILKGTLAAEKKALDTQKRQESSKRREKQEEKLETKPQAEKGPIKTPKVPRMGFLDWIKNFIGNVILGYFAVRLVDYLPKIKPILKFLGSAADFIIDVGGKLLNGLVTFVDWGYKAIDFTRGALKTIGGENAAKAFDGFTGAVGTLIETAIIAATVIGSQGEGGLLDIGGELIGDWAKKRIGQQAVSQVGGQVAGQAGRTAGMGAGAVAAVVAGAGLLASALGEGAFQVRKVVVKPIQNLEKAYKEDRNPLTKIGRGIALTMVRPLYGLFSTVGFLLDVVGAPFRYAIELLRYPFLSEEDKVKQANNLAKFDARIREDLRKALNMLTLGLAFKEKGSFGNIYGNKGAQKEMMSKMAGGGITRGGKRQTRARRTIGKEKISRKYKRSLGARRPSEVEIKTDTDVGQKQKVFDFFGFVKNAINAVNPFNTIKTTGQDLGKTDYFGPILAITSKITLGQQPTQKDYENVGLGINMLISKGIKDKQLKGGVVSAFAEGGLVDPDVLSAVETGGDISNWVAKTFKGEIESNAQKTLRMIRENSEKKGTAEPAPSTGVTGGGTAGQFSPQGLQGEIYKYLLSKGMSDNHALGIMANIHRESGFRPGVSETGGPGVGLFQYSSGGRKSAFLRAVPDYATNWKGQIDFAIKEDAAPQYFQQKFTSPQDAADWWMRKWERPAEYIQNDKGPKIHAQYLAGLQQYKTNKGYEIPTGGASVSTAAATGPMGERQKNAGELGSFIKSLGVARGSGVHEHPQHGGIKHRHRGKGHYEGRAIDIGGWGGKYGRANLGKNFVDDQSAILAGINQFAAKTGKKPSLVLHGDNDPGHWDHVHAEYEKGGETLPYPHIARLGESGKEIVIDADSAGPAKDMLLAINQASGYKGVMKAIQQYAPYDALAPQTVVMQSPDTSTGGYSDSESSGLAMAFAGGGDDPFESLYQGG